MLASVLASGGPAGVGPTLVAARVGTVANWVSEHKPATECHFKVGVGQDWHAFAWGQEGRSPRTRLLE